MLETKKTKAPVTEIKVEKPEQVEANGKEPEQVEVNHKETAWHKTKILTAKGATAARSIARKISRLAGSATELAKGKIAINNLNIALNKIYHDTGEKVRQLNEQNELGAVKPHFSDELKRIDDLEQQVKKAQQNINKISFSN